MKTRVGFISNLIKRAITMFTSICIVFGSIAGYGNVVLAAEYKTDETVIETGKLNKNGTVIINGEVTF